MAMQNNEADSYKYFRMAERSLYSGDDNALNKLKDRGGKATKKQHTLLVSTDMSKMFEKQTSREDEAFPIRIEGIRRILKRRLQPIRRNI